MGVFADTPVKGGSVSPRINAKREECAASAFGGGLLCGSKEGVVAAVTLLLAVEALLAGQEEEGVSWLIGGVTTANWFVLAARAVALLSAVPFPTALTFASPPLREIELSRPVDFFLEVLSFVSSADKLAAEALEALSKNRTTSCGYSLRRLEWEFGHKCYAPRR